MYREACRIQPPNFAVIIIKAAGRDLPQVQSRSLCGSGGC